MENGPFLDNPSHVEYIVCTKALSNSKSNPILGFTLLQSPSGLLLLLGSGQVVSLDIITNPANLRHVLETSQSINVPKTVTSVSSKLFLASFETHIQKILSDGVSQPILKLNNTKDVSSKETLELVIYAFQVLRDQYIARHDKVKQEIEKRVKILQLLKEQQNQEIAQLLIDKHQIRNNAERLAEMYEEINDKQQNLFKQMHEIIRLVNLKLPRASLIEKNFGAQINKINTVTKELAHNITLTKKKMEKQQLQVN